MVLNVEQTVIEYLEKFGYLFESDSSILENELKTKDELTRIKVKYDRKKEELKKEHKNALEKVRDFAKDVGKEYSKELVDKFEDKVQLQTQRIRALHYMKLKELNKAELIELGKFSKKGTLIVSGIGLASLIIYASFKNFMLNKKISRLKCKGLTGEKRSDCIKREKAMMIHSRIQFLKKSVMRCNHSKDPVRCKDKIDEEILRLESKVKSYFNDIGSKVVRGKNW